MISCCCAVLPVIKRRLQRSLIHSDCGRRQLSLMPGLICSRWWASGCHSHKLFSVNSHVVFQSWCFLLCLQSGCEVLRSASLSVCLFVCRLSLAYLENYTSKFHQIVFHVTCCSVSLLLWRQWKSLCTSGFVDDVMFSRNGANGPESNTRMFRPVCQVSASVGRQTTLFGWVSQDVSTWDEVGCIRLHLFKLLTDHYLCSGSYAWVLAVVMCLSVCLLVCHTPVLYQNG